MKFGSCQPCYRYSGRVAIAIDFAALYGRHCLADLAHLISSGAVPATEVQTEWAPLHVLQVPLDVQ